MTQVKDSQRSHEIQALVNDSDFLKQLLQSFLQQHLESEITEYLQAEPYERSEKRTGRRNGYKPRDAEDQGRNAQPAGSQGS